MWLWLCFFLVVVVVVVVVICYVCDGICAPNVSTVVVDQKHRGFQLNFGEIIRPQMANLIPRQRIGHVHR